jgi:hypothetical protein
MYECSEDICCLQGANYASHPSGLITRFCFLNCNTLAGSHSGIRWSLVFVILLSGLWYPGRKSDGSVTAVRGAETKDCHSTSTGEESLHLAAWWGHISSWCNLWKGLCPVFRFVNVLIVYLFTELLSRASQGSVLGPLLFNILSLTCVIFLNILDVFLLLMTLQFFVLLIQVLIALWLSLLSIVYKVGVPLTSCK